MKRFFQKITHFLLYGKSFKLGRLENICISEWQNCLPPDTKTKMTQQLDILTFVQRHLGGKMLVFSSYTPDAREKNHSLRLNLKGDFRLAVLSAEVDDVKLNVELWAFNGFFHSICYNQIPPVNYSAVSVRILKNFMQDSMTMCESIDALPPDYDAFYAIKETLEGKGIKLFHKENITRIPIFELWYSVLCQIDDRYYIARLCDSEEEEMILYDFIDDEIIKSGKTMKELIVSVKPLNELTP